MLAVGGGPGCPVRNTVFPEVFALFGPTGSGKSVVAEALADRLDTEVVSADALDPVHGVAGAQELSELRAQRRRQVASPGVHVLSQQRDLLDAVAREPLNLGNDVAGAPALLAAAHGGNDAVRALRVAPHRHLHPRLEAAFPM